MARDGKSFLTSVGTQYSTIWIHDARGEHQMSSEGDTLSATFSTDATKLFYLKKAGQNDVAELSEPFVAKLCKTVSVPFGLTLNTVPTLFVPP